jgi:hypothetical protein
MIVGGDRIEDDICFRKFSPAKITDCIVIEEEKQFYPQEQIEEYFQDLQ